MRAKKLETCRRRLSSDAPVIGGWMRRWAVRELARDDALESIRALAEFAANCPHGPLLDQALEALQGITSAPSIDGLCAVWAETRSSILWALIFRNRWIAFAPAPVRVLIALKARHIELILAGSAEVIDPLVASCADADPEIADCALECLGRLRNFDAIDALCSRWVQRRETAVAEALERTRYVARQPLAVRVFTALKAQRRDLITSGGPEIIDPLIQASHDSDPLIVRQAAQAMRELTGAQAREALCQCVIESGEPAPRQAALDARFAPSDATQRALFYFLTEQWTAYESLDFDLRLLGRAYETGSKKLRGRIAERGRQSGRADWLVTIVGARHDRRLGEMSDEEWEAALAVLRENKRWEDSWHLAQVAPPDWSARLLAQLRASKWRPSGERDQESFDSLNRMIDGCWEEPPFLGRLMRSASLLEGHTGAVSCLVVCRDARTLASGGNDRTVRLWNLGDGLLHQTFEDHADWVDCLALSPDERVLASAGRDHSVVLRSWPDGARLHRLEGHTNDVRCLAFSADGHVLASGSGDASVRLWSVRAGQLAARLDGHSDAVSCLAASPKGDWLASGSYDNDIRLWSVADGKLVATLNGHRAMVNCVLFDPDGSALVSGSKDRAILIWNLSDRMKSKRLKGHRDDVSCLAISPDGTLLASGSWDTTVRLWRMADGELLDTLGASGTNDGHSGWVSCLAFSPDGKVLASGGFDHTVRLWSVPGGAPLKTLEGHEDRVTCVRFSADGRTLFSASADRSIRVWRSELARLRRLPVSQTTREDLNWVENALPNTRLSDAERGWMEFVFALMRSRRRFDIDLGEAARMSIGEFDIELAG